MILSELASGGTDGVSLARSCRIAPSVLRDVLDELVETKLVIRIGDGVFAHYRLRCDAIAEFLRVLARMDCDTLDEA